MRVDVAELKLEAGSHKTVPVEVALEPVEIGGQSVQFDRPFKGEAEIWNAGDRLLVRATLSGEAQLACNRCLTDFSLPLETSFEEEFIEGQPGQDKEEDEAESLRAVNYYTGDAIDLSETLRDNVLLELPMKALCREDCAGLCPTCGTNLNEGSCSCVETTSVDPRLAALEKLLRKPDSNS
jgi:uncharacterized protein